MWSIYVPRSGPEAGWVMESDQTYAGVQCLDNYDVTGDGVRDLIVARHDGNIEVYSYEDGEDVEPTHKFTHNCGESVTSIEGGVVSQPGTNDPIRVSTLKTNYGCHGQS